MIQIKKRIKEKISWKGKKNDVALLYKWNAASYISLKMVGYRLRRFFSFGLRQEYGMSIWTARRGAMLRAACQNGAAHLCFLSFLKIYKTEKSGLALELVFC